MKEGTKEGMKEGMKRDGKSTGKVKDATERNTGGAVNPPPVFIF